MWCGYCHCPQWKRMDHKESEPFLFWRGHKNVSFKVGMRSNGCLYHEQYQKMCCNVLDKTKFGSLYKIVLPLRHLSAQIRDQNRPGQFRCDLISSSQALAQAFQKWPNLITVHPRKLFDFEIVKQKSYHNRCLA